MTRVKERARVHRISLSAGTLEYEDSGGSGRTVRMSDTAPVAKVPAKEPEKDQPAVKSAEQAKLPVQNMVEGTSLSTPPPTPPIP